jgi:predicted enzyme related to lactoylglutathione lyase
MARVLINIDVDDLPKALAFYTAAFELRIGRRLGADVIELLGAQAPIYLLTKRAGTSAVTTSVSITRDYRRHWTAVHLDFVVDDLDAALVRAQTAGARLEGDVRSDVWGKLALLSDPFGHGFCLLQFLGRGYDELV